MVNSELIPKDFLEHPSLPVSFIMEDFIKSLKNKDFTSLRLNEKKYNSLSAEIVPWCKNGYYLNERPVFTMDPNFHAGAYYVQEASSMFLSEVVQQLKFEEPVLALDLSAAPGGKSTILLESLPTSSLLIANEPITQRNHILQENLNKWGQGFYVITKNYAADFGKLELALDLIMLDAPCSGEGMFRKDPDSMKEWSLTNVNTCAERQENIIEELFPILKTGGYLIYSTCTFNTIENDAIVKNLIDTKQAEIVKLEVNPNWGILESEYGYRFYPQLVKGEGFFISVLRKTSDVCNQNKARHFKLKTPLAPESINDWTIDSNDNYFEAFEEYVFECPLQFQSVINYLTHHLKVYQKGNIIARKKGKDWIPSQELSWNTRINESVFPQYKFNLSDSLSYLKGEDLRGLDLTTKGFKLLKTEQGLNLSFGNWVGNRLINQFPNQMRIRMNIDLDKVSILS